MLRRIYVSRKLSLRKPTIQGLKQSKLETESADRLAKGMIDFGKEYVHFGYLKQQALQFSADFWLLTPGHEYCKFCRVLSHKYQQMSSRVFILIIIYSSTDLSW
jgi:hypothetical protein